MERQDLTLGPWRIQPTAAIRKHRRRRDQVLLLFPPSGFTGGVRLGVIDGNSRQEFSAHWRDGRQSGVPAALEPMLEERFGASWPIPVAAGLDTSRTANAVHADLLLEEIPVGEGNSAAAPLSGRITVPVAPQRSRVYLAPVLPEPRGSDRPGDLLAAALAAAHGNRGLRLALPASWVPLLAPAQHRERTRELAAAGRLELLLDGPDTTDRLAALGLPFPPRVGLLRSDDYPARVPRDLGALLLLPSEGREESSGVGPPPGMPAQLVRDEQATLLLSPGPIPRHNPLRKHLEAYAASLLTEAVFMAQTAGVRMPPRSSGPPARRQPKPRLQVEVRPPIGFIVCLLSRPEDWQDLGSTVSRWNREHSAPGLFACTPADYVAALIELHTRGLLHLPRV